MTTTMNKKDWEALYNKGVLPEGDHQSVTDWEMRYKEGTDNKYGSLMYSPSIQRLRVRTFQEFYGGGIVD